MKKMILITFMVATTLAAMADNPLKDKTKTEVRSIENFNAVTVTDGIDLYLTQSDAISLTVEANPKILEILRTEVKGGTLKIYLDRERNVFRDEDIKVFLSYKQIDQLSGSAGADIETKNEMLSNDLKVNLSSGSDLKMRLKGQEVKFNMSSGADAELFFEGKFMKVTASSGSEMEAKANGLDKVVLNMSSGSDIELDGSAAELFVDASSGSDLDAYNFIAVNADIDASSASDIKITVVGDLRADASSASSIKYKGKVKNRDVNASSLGSVRGN